MNDDHQILISIVSPVYKAEALIAKLVDRIKSNVVPITGNYEIILVEDGGQDGSWAAIDRICFTDPCVRGVKLSRNFGQHYAITAGLAMAKGDWIVVMDCDLQDLPEEIPNLYQKAISGFQIVFARRVQRQDSLRKRLSSKIFYHIFSYLTDTVQDHSIANFGIYHRSAINAILSMKDQIRYFPMMSQWVGFRKTTIDVQHGSRDDASSYTLIKLLQLAFDNMIAFSNKPLRLAIKLGIIISVISFLIGLFYLYQYAIGAIKVLGFASIMISIWFLSGVIIFTLGIIGLYIGKIFEASKNRPSYIIETILN